MKKFYTCISIQPLNKLCLYRYEAVDNAKLAMDAAIAFPILTAVSGYVAPEEDFRVVAVCEDSENGKTNFEEFRRELDELCSSKDLRKPQVDVVMVTSDVGVSAQLETFRQLLQFAEDEDEIFACTTFGTKPMSEVLLMAVRYGYRVKKNTMISCVVYGQIVRTSSSAAEWYGQVYDMTAIVHMDEIVHTMAAQKVADPMHIINRMLEF